MRIFALLLVAVSLLKGQGLSLLTFDTDFAHILLLTHGTPDGLAHAYNTGVFWANPGNVTDTVSLVTMDGSLRHVFAPGTHGEPPNITRFNYKRTLAGAGTGLFGSIEAYGTYHPPTGHWDVFYAALYGEVTSGTITGFAGGVVGVHIATAGPLFRGGGNRGDPPPAGGGPCGPPPGGGGGFGFGGVIFNPGTGEAEVTAGDCNDDSLPITRWVFEFAGGSGMGGGEIDLLPTMQVYRALNRIIRRARITSMTQAAIDAVTQGIAVLKTTIGSNSFITPLEILPSAFETFAPLTLTRGGWRFNQGTGTLVTTVTLRNNTGAAIQGPAAFAVRAPFPALVQNRTGDLLCGSAILGPPGTAYVIVSADFPPGASRTVPIEMMGLSLTSVNQVHLTQAVSVPLPGISSCR